jgi:hypothetical protein
MTPRSKTPDNFVLNEVLHLRSELAAYLAETANTDTASFATYMVSGQIVPLHSDEVDAMDVTRDDDDTHQSVTCSKIVLVNCDGLQRPCVYSSTRLDANESGVCHRCESSVHPYAFRVCIQLVALSLTRRYFMHGRIKHTHV